MRIAAVILLILGGLSAAENPGSLDALAAGWLTLYDMNDFADFARAYEPPPPPPPDCNEITMSVNQYEFTQINFAGLRCDRFEIRSLPQHGYLYDFYRSRPTSLTPSILQSYGQNFNQITTIPYRLKNTNEVWYISTDPNADAFNYAAVNSLDNLSDTNSVTITKAAYTGNAVFVDGSGYIEIPDSNLVDFNDSFSFTCWIKPDNRFGTVIDKLPDDGAGLRISVEALHIILDVCNQAGNKGRYVCKYALTENEWNYIGLSLSAADPNCRFIFTGKDLAYESLDTLPLGDYSNSQTLRIGSRFIGQVDKLTWWPAKNDSSMSVLGIEKRTKYGGIFAPTDYRTRFKMDAGTGSQITDDSNSITGTLNNATWTPAVKPRQNKYHYHKIGD